jgi:hypothetical protein
MSIPPLSALIQDLKPGRSVTMYCNHCRAGTEIATDALRRSLPPRSLVRDIGTNVRCRTCKQKGARIDAVAALK